jgi:hypothetical protein
MSDVTDPPLGTVSHHLKDVKSRKHFQSFRMELEGGRPYLSELGTIQALLLRCDPCKAYSRVRVKRGTNRWHLTKFFRVVFYGVRIFGCKTSRFCIGRALGFAMTLYSRSIRQLSASRELIPRTQYPLCKMIELWVHDPASRLPNAFD